MPPNPLKRLKKKIENPLASFAGSVKGAASYVVEDSPLTDLAEGLRRAGEGAAEFGGTFRDAQFSGDRPDAHSAVQRSAVALSDLTRPFSPGSLLRGRQTGKETRADIKKAWGEGDALGVAQNLASPVAEAFSTLHDTTLPLQTAAHAGYNRTRGYDDYGPGDTRSIDVTDAHAGIARKPVLNPKTGQPIQESGSGRGRLLDRIVSGGIDVASDPATFVPAGAFKNVPKVPRLALEMATGMGGETAAQNLTRGLIFKGTQAGAVEGLRAAGLDKEDAERGSMLLAPVLGMSVIKGAEKFAPEAVANLVRTQTRAQLLTSLDDKIRGLTEAEKPIPAALAHARETVYQRLYHGTGSAFDAPDPGRFATDGLYGPAYYLTDNPKIASSYAITRAGADGAAGVRPVDVPRGLNLFDTEADGLTATTLTNRLRATGRTELADAIDQHLGDRPYNGDQVYRMVEGLTGSRQRTNRVLALAGYDGVRYPGGQHMPLQDANGSDILHNAVAVFPESLPKVRNALSGTAMGAVESTAGAKGPGDYWFGPRVDPKLESIANSALSRIAQRLDGGDATLNPEQVQQARRVAVAKGLLPPGVLGAADEGVPAPRPEPGSFAEEIAKNAGTVAPVAEEAVTQPWTLGRVLKTPYAATFAPSATRDRQITDAIVDFDRAVNSYARTFEGEAQGAARATAAQDLKRTLEAIPGMTVPPAKDAELLPKGYEAVHLPHGGGTVWARADVADALHDYLDNPRGGARGLVGLLGRAAQEAKATALGADFAIPILRTPAAWLQAATYNPVRATGAVVQAFRDMLNPDAMRAEPGYREWAKRFAGMGFEEDARAAKGASSGLAAALEMEQMPLANRLPGIGKLYRWSDDVQFARLVPALKYRLAESMAASMKNGDDPAARRQIANQLSLFFDGLDRARAGASRSADREWSAFMLSPSLFRGSVSLLTGAAKPGLEGAMARRFWGGFALFSLATVAGLDTMLSNDYDPEHIKDRLSLFSSNSITNPNSSHFLKFRLPGSDEEANMWGPMRTLIRMVLQPVAAGIGAGNEAWQGSEHRDAMAALSAIGQGLEAAGGRRDVVWDWLVGRKSMTVGMASDLLHNRDFRDRRIFDRNAPFPEVAGKASLYAGSQLLPSWSGLVLSDDKGPIPSFDPSRDTLVKGGADFLGLSVTPGKDLPPAVRGPMEAFVRSFGLEPGDDLVATYRSAAIPQHRRTEFEAGNRAVKDYFAGETAKRAEGQLPDDTRDRYTLYRGQVVDAEKTRNDKMAQLQKEWDSGQTRGNDWRKRRTQIQQEYGTKVEGAGEYFLQEKDPAKRQKLIDDLFGGRETPKDPADQMIQALNDLAPADESDAAYDDFARQRRRFLLTGELVDRQGNVVKKYGQQTADRVRQYLIDKQPSELERRYQAALLTYGGYQAMPRWTNIRDPRMERMVSDALNAARSDVRFGKAENLRQALLGMRGVSPRVRQLAIEVSGGQFNNVKRAEYLKRYGRQLSEFYGDIMPRLFEEMATGN